MEENFVKQEVVMVWNVKYARFVIQREKRLLKQKSSN